MYESQTYMMVFWLCAIYLEVSKCCCGSVLGQCENIDVLNLEESQRCGLYLFDRASDEG